MFGENGKERVGFRRKNAPNGTSGAGQCFSNQREIAMKDERTSHDGDRKTGYRAQNHPGPRRSSVLSWWSLAIVAIFLLLVIGSALLM
jgi:hypothetical protein